MAESKGEEVGNPSSVDFGNGSDERCSPADETGGPSSSHGGTAAVVEENPQEEIL